MKVSADELIDAVLDHTFYLVGDVECGVSLYCRPCWDGGRPIAYYSTDPDMNPYLGDNRVAKPDTIPGLFAAAARHRTAARHDEQVSADVRA
ncbi:MAG TPA: hypothetical protein VKZ89_09065 [Thermobifida alba]|nr:hypothetical protein [Thermobifida alba]